MLVAPGLPEKTRKTNGTKTKKTEKKHTKNRLAYFITGEGVINLFRELAYFNYGGCINCMWTLYMYIIIYILYVCVCVRACVCIWS